MKIDDEVKALLLLISLPLSFEKFKDTLICGKEGYIFFGGIQTGVRSNQFSKMKDLKIEDISEGLSV